MQIVIWQWSAGGVLKERERESAWEGAVRGVTFQLCLTPGSFGKSSSSAGLACISERAGASKRDNNSLNAKIEISGCGSPGVPQLLHVKDPTQLTHSSQSLTLEHRPPIWQDFILKLRSWCYFLLKIWFSVEPPVPRANDNSCVSETHNQISHTYYTFTRRANFKRVKKINKSGYLWFGVGSPPFGGSRGTLRNHRESLN